MNTVLKDRIRATEPTGLAPPDLERVRQRGRHRRIATRTAATIGSVAVVAVALAGVANLVASPEGVEPVAPTVEESPVVTTAGLAAELDLQVLRIWWTPEDFTGFTTEQVSPSGDSVTSEWMLEPGHGDVPVATASGRLWALDGNGRTVLYDPSTGSEVTATTGEANLGWLPLATTDGGDALVTAIPLDPDPVDPNSDRPGPTLRQLPADGELTMVPGVDVASATSPQEFIGLAAVAPEHVAFAAFGQGSSRVLVQPVGGTPVTALDITGADSRVVDIAFVGDELWAVEIAPSDDTATLHRFALDGTPIDAVPLELGGPTAWRMTVGPRAGHVVIPVGPRSATPVSHILDVSAIREGANPADAARRVEGPGVIQLLPPGGQAPTP